MSISKSSNARAQQAAGQSRLERLPPELLRKILIFVTLVPTQDSSKIAVALQDPNHINQPLKAALTSLPCLLSSRTLHMATLSVMYRDITTSRPPTFNKFLAQLRCHPSLGTLVRSLDLAPISRTIQFADDPKLANPIPELLRLTPLLRSFTARPGFQQYLDQPVLRRLFSDLPLIEALDFADCNSPTFAWEFAQLCSNPGYRISPSITTLSLRGCLDLPPIVFETLLPQLLKLESLDVAYTQITAEALVGIPSSAKLVRLDVSHCDFLSGDGLAAFLANHYAVKTSLVELTAETNPELQPLYEEEVTQILAAAPRTLRALNLKNSNMTGRHLPFLQVLTRQLEELTVGSHLSLLDIEALFLSPESVAEKWTLPETDERTTDSMSSKYNIVLDPMEEAVAVCRLRRRLNSTEIWRAGKQPRLRYLDISGLSTVEQGKIRTSVLLGPHSGVLEVVEVSEKVLSRYGIITRLCKAVGWDVRNTGRRCWLVRKNEKMDEAQKIWRSVW